MVLFDHTHLPLSPIMIKLEVNWVTKQLSEGTLDAFTSRTIPGPRHNRPVFPFKYYICKVVVGGQSLNNPAYVIRLDPSIECK